MFIIQFLYYLHPLIMRILVLQHVPFEGPALILQWAEQRQHDLRILRTYEIDHSQRVDFPALEEVDWLIVMGGPMSVNDPLPWLQAETEYIAAAIAADKRVLGICLGAQLIARAMGVDVCKHHCREIGWFPVETDFSALPASHWLHDALPPTFTPLHWHGDTFAIPAEATACFRSAVCENQGFVIGTRIVALQFHLELTHDTAQRLAEECAEELQADSGHSVQSADAILQASEHFAAAETLLNALLDAQAQT